MNITIHPKKLRGTVNVIPSKSQAHRYLICAALSDNETELICPETNRDMDATADCLRALGAKIERTDWGYRVTPISKAPETAVLPSRDSGSTLRFLLPVVGALGVDATFQMEGRLPQRPLSPLWEEMERMGCRLSRPTADTIRCEGQLRPGAYTIPGNISSQYITGLLLGLSLLDGSSSIKIPLNLDIAWRSVISAAFDELRRGIHPEFPEGLPGHGNIGLRFQLAGDFDGAASVEKTQP